jgi:uncharacterized protein (DUF1778 family)
MATKRAKSAQIVIRLDEKERKALEKDAEAAMRGLSDYVRYLLLTHAERGKGKK